MRVHKIREFVKIVEESDIDELEITRWWGQKVRIKKTSALEQVPGPAPVSTQPSKVFTQPASEQTGATDVSPAEEKPAPPEERTDLIEIKAPMVGTFYRSPSPDSDPYIKEGDTITPGQVMCIIEAMKLMNEIEAELKGRVVKIMVENAQPVEFNQPLFLVEPA